VVDPWAMRTCVHCGKPTLIGHYESGRVVVMDGYADEGGSIAVLLMRDGKLIVTEKEAGSDRWKRAFFRHSERCRVETVIEAEFEVRQEDAA
jgi:hypothetical protein